MIFAQQIKLYNIINLFIIVNQSLGMSLILDKQQEIYERSDMHALASQVERNNFNIRRFNEKSNQKKYKLSMPTKYTQSSIKNRISTEPVEERFSSLSFTNTFQRIMSVNQPDSKKRNRLIGSLKHKNQSSDKIQPKQINQFDIHDIQFEKAKKCKQIDRKNNRGPLSKKIVETWLNSILTQSTQFQVIDESLGNAALKKFQIDQNSLLSRGIKPDNISKLYQSLFVHSIGFNNAIKQLVGNNNEVAKNIWKVFSILLQYCAEGKFQTVIGVIEKQKIIKIEQLREQVAKRQQIIQRNDELNETKNIQIFKQIRNLTQQNINLKNEKDILFEDYQKTQQAFNEEVILRLKFQNKINQLFGIHRQLAIKHQRLYEDYKKKTIQWATVNQKNGILTQQNSELKIHVADLTTQKLRLISSQKYNKQLIISLGEDVLKANSQYNLAKHQYDQQRRITKQLRRRQTQIQIELKNLTEIVKLKDKSWKETHSEYQLSLVQNNRLYSIISEQRVQVQQLLLEKKEFNNKILNIMADASFQKRKKQQFSALYLQADKKVKQYLERNKNLEQEIKILKNKNESNQQDLKQNYENIKKMHEKNSELQDQLYYLRKFKNSLDVVLKQKDGKSQVFRIENQKLINQAEQLKTSFNKLELTHKMLKQQFQIEVQNNQQKLEKLREQYSAFQKGEGQKSRLLNVTMLQLQKTRKLLQNTMLDYKNQKFQRLQVKTNYDQTLAMMQKKNIQQKQLGRQISQLKDSVLKITHERDRTAYALQNQILRRQRTQQQLKLTQQKYEEHKQKKSSFVHPFIYEDTAQNFRILKQKLQKAQKTISIKLDEIKQLNIKYKSQIQNLKKSHNDYLTSYKKQKQKQLYLKQSELQYEKQTNQGLKLRLNKLEALAQTYAKKIEQRTTSEKEKLYADMIEHKTKTIQQLMQKVSTETTKNEKMRLEVIKKQQQYQFQLININKKHNSQKGWLQQKINDLNFQITHIRQQAERLKKQISQSQNNFQNKLKERMEMYLENFKKSQSIYEEKEQHDLMGPSLNSMNDTKKDPNDTGAKWRAKMNPEIKKRNNIAKKIKMAYDYYNN